MRGTKQFHEGQTRICGSWKSSRVRDEGCNLSRTHPASSHEGVPGALQGPLNSALGVIGNGTESWTLLAAVAPAYPPSSFAFFQCCVLLLLMAMEPTVRPGCFSKTTQYFCLRMWSMLLMVTQKCMSCAFYPLNGFPHCFCPEFLRSPQPALAICSFQVLDTS